MHTDINRSVKRLAITCLWNWRWRTTVLPKWFVIPCCVSLLDIPHLPVVILNPVVLGVVAEAKGSEWALVTLSHGVLRTSLLLLYPGMFHVNDSWRRENRWDEGVRNYLLQYFFFFDPVWRVTSWTPPLAVEKPLLQKLQRMKEVPFLAHGYIIVFPLWLPLARPFAS